MKAGWLRAKNGQSGLCFQAPDNIRLTINDNGNGFLTAGARTKGTPKKPATLLDRDAHSRPGDPRCA